MVEFNGGDYATYLNRVFADDPEFQAVATDWAAAAVRWARTTCRCPGRRRTR